jgi:hypothetical protein
MASTYSPLKIELIGTGEQSGTWGTTTNTNLGTAIEEAIVGSADVAFSSADVTLTLTDTNAAQIARNLRLNLTGTSGGARNLILGAGCQIEKPYIINNGLADTVTVKNTTGTGVAVPAGKSMWVYNNGTNVVDVINFLSGAGTVTSVATGTGLTGGPITTTGTVSVATNGISNTLLRQSAGLSLIGRSASTTGNVADITAGTDHQVLRRSSTSIAFGSIALNQSAAVTGTLPVGNGGTGGTTFTANNVLLGNGTSAFQVVAPSTSGNVLTSNGTTWTSAAPSISLSANNAFTGANTFFNGTGQTFGTGTSSQDGIIVAGRAGGSSSFRITLAPATLAASRTLSLPDPGSNETLGYLNIPQVSQSAAYTLVITDAGKHILHPSADTTARTFTIPANGSVAFPIGTAITFVNQNGAGVVTIAITTDTMRLAGAGTTGSRTLAANGVATAIKITSTEWIISGTGLT